MFWNHSKQHSSKTIQHYKLTYNSFGTIRNSTALKLKNGNGRIQYCFGTIRNSTALKLALDIHRNAFGFGTIRNSTALKPILVNTYDFKGFGTIRNSTALKLCCLQIALQVSFGTIRNSTALKLVLCSVSPKSCFGTIRNSTALKPRGLFFLTKFRNRAICLSQTSASNSSFMLALLYLKSLVISMFLSIHIIYSCNFFSKAWVKTSE